jgi:hypothetical protein
LFEKAVIPKSEGWIAESNLSLSPVTNKLASDAWNTGSVSIVIYPASLFKSEILSPAC